jgi:hypothetical protein
VVCARACGQNRYNIAWGIPDKWFYMFGDAVIGPAVMMFAFMPAVVLTSKLVPKGLESTTYALLAGAPAARPLLLQPPVAACIRVRRPRPQGGRHTRGCCAQTCSPALYRRHP